MIKSKYFRIEELVPQHIHEKLGEKAWRLLSRELIWTIDKLKEVFPKGTITINNWVWGGPFNWSGLRTPTCPEYSETSMHSLGEGADCKFSAYTADTVTDYIINNPGDFPYVKGLELGKSWVHVDTRNELTLVTFKG